MIRAPGRVRFWRSVDAYLAFWDAARGLDAEPRLDVPGVFEPVFLAASDLGVALHQLRRVVLEVPATDPS
jgi:hypothetical protein